VADDPRDNTRRVLSVLKWNLNVPRPPSVAWTLAPVPLERSEAILKDCDHLTPEDKQKLTEQLQCLVWQGVVDLTADDLLQPPARAGLRAQSDEITKAAVWLTQFLANGPEGAVRCAREGDRAMGRTWPDQAQLAPKEYRIRALGRVKWWRRLLAEHLGGDSKRAEFGGPWFFRLRDHQERGLWPPSTEATERSKHADYDLPEPDDPWLMRVRMSPT
jgi:hypothetical protein